MNHHRGLASLGILDNFFVMQNLLDLGMLILLQAVLGFDNLLYISLESKRAPLEKQKMVRVWGDWPGRWATYLSAISPTPHARFL